MEVSFEVRELTKVYGSTVANHDMSISLRAGEVHGLLGQNGAGKSTLVGILTGNIRPDGGEVVMDGIVLDLSSPEAARRAGIVAVYQNLLLVPTMTGLENIGLALGMAPTRALRVRLEELAERHRLSLTLDTAVMHLDMAARQRLEFARALLQEPKLLLLDEPTTFLPPSHVDDFLQTVELLASSGLAVLLITHRLDEARRVCQRVTVIRGGTAIAEYGRATLPNNRDLAYAMLGESVAEPAHSSAPRSEIALEVTALATGGSHDVAIALHGIDLEVHAGEIVGIGGVDGNGQVDLLEAMAGIQPAQGRVRLGTRDVSHDSYAERFEAGLQLVSADRVRHGVVPELTVFEHFDFALENQRPEVVLAQIGDFDVRPLALDVPVSSLSGGNQQKVIMARAFAAKPAVLMLAYPTQGLDVKAAARIHATLIDGARDGLAVIVVSSDLDELIVLSDRLMVMYRGRVVGEQRRGETDRKILARWFAGVSDSEAALAVH